MTTSHTFWEAFVKDPMRRRAAWISNLLVFFQARSEAVFFYTRVLVAQSILKMLDTQTKVNGSRTYTIVICSVWCSHFLSIFVFSRFGRRDLINTGFAFQFLCNFLMAVFYYFGINIALAIVATIYLVTFTTMTGPGIFAFCIEVNTDISLGVAMA